MTDAERIIWLESFIKRIAERLRHGDDLQQVLDEIQTESTTDHAFLTGGWR